MSSESLFKQCRQCKKSIHQSDKVCSFCGSKQYSKNWIYWCIAGIVIVIALANSDQSPKSTTATTAHSVVETKGVSLLVEKNLPESEASFVSIVSKYSQAFRDAKNQLHESTLRDERREALKQAFPSVKVDEWVGTIKNLETNSEGKAIVVIKIAPDIELRTWNNLLSDMVDGTMIEKDSQMYQTLLTLPLKQKVVFSGSFIRSEVDHFEEQSITIDGSMKKPEFLFKFRLIKPI